MVHIHTLNISPPLINSSCAWASDYSQLHELYNCSHTGAVTTRTATIEGFSEDSSHTVAFASNETTSINSYGYSPHPLSSYLEWVRTLLTTPDSSGSLPTKPIIISITASAPDELSSMLQTIQDLRGSLRSEIFGGDHSTDASSLIAIELNTSCPNIKNKPPPAYEFSSMAPLLDVLASAFRSDTTFTIGLKLPPYIYSTQFTEVVECLGRYTELFDGHRRNPFAFLTCTNTLGSTLLFAHQTNTSHSASIDNLQFALPTGLGGLAGEALHSLALGNVFMLSQLLMHHNDSCLRDISIVGVGGVTTMSAASRMRQAGATVVGCATLLGQKGIAAFASLNQSV